MQHIIICLFAFIYLFVSVNTFQNRIVLHEVATYGDKNILLNIMDVIPFNSNSILVCDKLDYSFKLIEETGTISHSIGKRGKSKGDFMGPGNIAFNQENIIVADFSSSRIQMFDKKFEYMKKFYSPGPVFDLNVDKNKNFWIACYTGNKNEGLFLYNRSGKRLKNVKLRNTTGDLFKDIFTFTITNSNYLIICYIVQNKIEVLDLNGNFINEFVIKTLPKFAKEKVIQKNVFSKDLIAPEGNITQSIASDRKNNIYILGGDYSPNPFRDIYIYDVNGKFIQKIVLPQKASLININKEDMLYSVHNKRRIIKKYKIDLILEKR